MELINQHTKQIMEGCKERARQAGLCFQDESLEYIVTNKDLLELGPKNMIPTLYDYWVHDVEVLKELGKYELYPHNPYETVINTRPPISFYNDNNPDWLNVMIFYHVLAHIDFFQNNMMYRHTWNEDFTGRALSDKRFVAMLRSEKGRWVDYVIEFVRGIDNLVGFYPELSDLSRTSQTQTTKRIDYYFDVFLQGIKKVKQHEYLKEIERYNQVQQQFDELVAESIFFSKVSQQYPEFESLYKKHNQKHAKSSKDLIEYIQNHSPFLAQDENKWMQSILQIIRNTSLYFQPQIRTKILNEGWASYWHEKLFLEDDRIKGHEVDFARVNAKVTALPRVGLNPYALGMRLFGHVESGANKGRHSYDFERLSNVEERKKFDQQTGSGQKAIFDVRENYSDFMFINTFVDQDFVDAYKLFVSEKRLNEHKGVWEYTIKSRKTRDYKQMLLDTLYHPPLIEIRSEKTNPDCVYLDHRFEGKPLVNAFIANTMLGISFLWGGAVKLETTELAEKPTATQAPISYQGLYGIPQPKPPKSEPQYQRVVYTMQDKKLSKDIL